MTQNQMTQILTPVGRLVAGDPLNPQKTDSEGRPLTIKNGPNAGQPRVEFFIAIAIPKNSPDWPDLWAKIHTEAKKAFPSLFDAAGNCSNPQFAYKVTDGDSQKPNTKGVRPCDREGYPGHWVVGFSSGFAPKCYTRGGESLISDSDAIKRGYWIRISGNVRGNGSDLRPGVFLNHQMIELCGYGTEIVSGPDGASVFGGAPVALPSGASETPLAPAAPAPAAPAPAAPAPAAPAPAAPAPAAPAPAAPAPAAPAPAAPAPAAPDFLNPPEIKFTTPDGGAWTQSGVNRRGLHC